MHVGKKQKMTIFFSTLISFIRNNKNIILHIVERVGSICLMLSYPVPKEWPQPKIGAPCARLRTHRSVSITSDTTPVSSAGT